MVKLSNSFKYNYVMLLFLVLIIFLVIVYNNTYFYKNTKENFNSLSKGSIVGIIFGVLLLLYIVNLIISGLYDGYLQR
jgi:hypothetical protein